MHLYFLKTELKLSIKFKIQFILLTLCCGFISACKTGNCRSQNPYPPSTDSSATALAMNDTSAKGGLVMSTDGKPLPTAANTALDSKERVRVFKYDGSKQCGMAGPTDLAQMQKDLGHIKVYSSENKADNLMHIAMCGSPTGRANVYEIDRKDLEAAKKKGFKEWVFE